jgi:hypothetical protein
MSFDLEKLLAPVADIPGQPFQVGGCILRSALDFPPDRFLAVAVGRFLGDWTTLGPFVGWRLEDVEAEALAAARDCADVRLVGPVRADDLRRMLFGGEAVAERRPMSPARNAVEDARHRRERSNVIAADLRSMALRLRASAARIRSQCPEMSASDRSLLEANAVALEASAEMLLATSGNLERGAAR